jgi:aminomethyltransferase
MPDLSSSSALEAEPTPLYDLHRALGARMVTFAGTRLPLHYAPGIIAEHLHVRAEAGLFDVSHMGQIVLEGPSAARRLETLVPASIATLAPLRMRYTQFLDPRGHILDDLVVTRLPDQEKFETVLLVVNAATKSSDVARLAALLPDLALRVEADRALLALQGPRAAAVLSRHFPGVERLSFMSTGVFENGPTEIRISRAGYTGEDGFEISIAARSAAAFAEKLLSEPEVRPAGLGARDSLRLEAGLCLHGHDIDATVDPVEAGLAWSIPERRRADGGFPGAACLRDRLATGPERRRVGFLIEGKAPAREGAIVTSACGDPVGIVTSGGFSPCLGRPIAMGYVASRHAAPQTDLLLSVRGKALEARVTALPFIPHRYFRGP